MDRPLRRRTVLQLGGAFAGILIAEGAGLASRSPLAAAAPDFTLNGFTVAEPFASYWLQTGGLAQHGLPLSNRLGEPSFIDGQPYAIQYFERAVFELHPEFVGTENEVLLQLLGREAYERRYGPSGAPDQLPNTAPDAVFFRETGKRLGGRFLAYWQQHGGLRQQGYPVSDEFREVSALDGTAYMVQYFERAVFEWHPEQAPPYDVLLTHLGRFRHDRPPALQILAPRDGETVTLPTEVRYALTDPDGALQSGAQLHAIVGDPATGFVLELIPTGTAGVALLPDDKRLPGRRDLTFVLARPDRTPYPNPLARATVRDLIIAGRR